MEEAGELNRLQQKIGKKLQLADAQAFSEIYPKMRIVRCYMDTSDPDRLTIKVDENFIVLEVFFG